MVNVGINQVSGILKAPYGVFQTIPEAERLMRRAMLEVVTLAKGAVIPLQEEEIEDFIGFLNTLSPEGKTSMLQDVKQAVKPKWRCLPAKFAGRVTKWVSLRLSMKHYWT